MKIVFKNGFEMNKKELDKKSTTKSWGVFFLFSKKSGNKNKNRKGLYKKTKKD